MNLVLGIVFFFGLALSFLFSGMESGMLSTDRLALRRRRAKAISLPLP